MKIEFPMFERKKENKNKYILAGSLITLGIAAAGAAYAAAVSFLMKVAFDREPPKSIKRVQHSIENSEENHEFVLDLEIAARELRKNCTEEYIITAEDGTELTAHYRPCPNPERLIIAFHGWRSSWSKDFGTIADEWYGMNCNVLYVEQRGQNNSGGNIMGFGVLERFDARDWAEFAADKLAGNLPVYLAGVSMGAATVLMATGLDLPGNVHGILADCGFTSPDTIWRHVLQDNLHLPYDETIYDLLAKQKIGVGAKEISTTEALKYNHIPVMFAHGTDDGFVPVTMTYDNYKACIAPKRLLIVPGADHGMSHSVDPIGYAAAERAFFADFDDVVPAPRDKTPAELEAMEKPAEEQAAEQHRSDAADGCASPAEPTDADSAADSGNGA
ncbi:MAG: alpha/beta hydrolase [Clostridia bacterium]|nr:alpha/beta hydrolase [Clostridia bacterium]